MKRLSHEPYWSSLRRYAGVRINLFRAMHDGDFHISGDHRAVAVREGEHALVARTAFDPILCYFYVADCHWYHSTLQRVGDAEVPETVRLKLLRRFHGVLS